MWIPRALPRKRRVQNSVSSLHTQDPSHSHLQRVPSGSCGAWADVRGSPLSEELFLELTCVSAPTTKFQENARLLIRWWSHLYCVGIPPSTVQRWRLQVFGEIIIFTLFIDVYMYAVKYAGCTAYRLLFTSTHPHATKPVQCASPSSVPGSSTGPPASVPLPRVNIVPTRSHIN